MGKLLLLLKATLIVLIPLLVAILYGIFIGNVNVNSQETYEVEENLCEIPEDAPEDQVIIDFLEKSYESVINQKDGNIPMVVFEQRLEYATDYRPEISDYLETRGYRYQLPTEAQKTLEGLVEEDSYSKTVNNIHNWIIENIDYNYNRNWYTAESTWEEKAANCNGISFLSCGMMREVGIPCIVVANHDHAWTEYLYVDDQGRLVWNVWDQGLEGYPVLGNNVYEYDLD